MYAERDDDTASMVRGSGWDDMASMMRDRVTWLV